MLFSKSAHFVIDKLEEKGFSAYSVGGAVRDILMNKTPSDFDIATSARPEEIKKVFSDCRVIETGIRHGTVTVLCFGEAVEITSFRSEGRYSDSRHPEKVEFGVSLYEDLSRRDFTVNAIAMDKNGEIVDPFGGRADIENEILRTVGDPEKRFSEDALRILRGVRFLSVLGFSVSPETEKAMLENCHLLKNISGERKSEELKKILTAPFFKPVAKKFIPVYKEMFPRFSLVLADEIDSLPKDYLLRLSKALYNSSKEEIDALRPDRETAKRIKILINEKPSSAPDEAQLKKLYIKYGIFGRKVLEFNKISTDTWDRLLSENKFFSREELSVNGEDIKAIGLRGEKIGRAIDFLLTALAENKVSPQKDELIKFLLQNLSEINA